MEEVLWSGVRAGAAADGHTHERTERGVKLYLHWAPVPVRCQVRGQVGRVCLAVGLHLPCSSAVGDGRLCAGGGGAGQGQEEVWWVSESGRVRPGGMQHNEGKENQQRNKKSQSKPRNGISDCGRNRPIKPRSKTPQNKHKETLKQKKLKGKLYPKLLNAKWRLHVGKSGIQHGDQIGISDRQHTFKLSTATSNSNWWWGNILPLD